MTTFTQRLDTAAAVIEARLGKILDQAGRPPAPPRLAEAMRYAVLGTGKRFRPALTIETARLFGCVPEQAVDAAAAVELVHCYSLAHDDLPAMDNDDLRRGRPTVHRAYDEWTAILVGDALQTLAFEVLARASTHPDPAVRAELVSILAGASGPRGMCGGQALDLAAERIDKGSAWTIEDVRCLQSMKTGALIRAACESGAVLGGADSGARAAVRAYGEALGSAFQIADDLLDAVGETETVGKAVAKDAAAGKATFVSLLGIEGARAEIVKAEAKADEALARFGDAADVLRGAFRFAIQRVN